MKTKQNFTHPAGSDLAIIFTVTGVGVDLSSLAEARWVLARDERSDAVLDRKKTEGDVTVDAPNSTVTVPLDGADTLALKGDYYHELWLKDTAGNEKTVASGWATFRESAVANLNAG